MSMSNCCKNCEEFQECRDKIIKKQKDNNLDDDTIKAYIIDIPNGCKKILQEYRNTSYKSSIMDFSEYVKFVLDLYPHSVVECSECITYATCRGRIISFMKENSIPRHTKSKLVAAYLNSIKPICNNIIRKQHTLDLVVKPKHRSSLAKIIKKEFKISGKDFI